MSAHLKVAMKQPQEKVAYSIGIKINQFLVLQFVAFHSAPAAVTGQKWQPECSAHNYFGG